MAGKQEMLEKLVDISTNIEAVKGSKYASAVSCAALGSWIVQYIDAQANLVDGLLDSNLDKEKEQLIRSSAGALVARVNMDNILQTLLDSMHFDITDDIFLEEFRKNTEVCLALLLDGMPLVESD